MFFCFSPSPFSLALFSPFSPSPLPPSSFDPLPLFSPLSPFPPILQDVVAELGKLLYQGPLLVSEPKFKIKVEKERQVFAFQSTLLFARKIELPGQAKFKYECKFKIPVSQLFLFLPPTLPPSFPPSLSLPFFSPSLFPSLFLLSPPPLSSSPSLLQLENAKAVE